MRRKIQNTPSSFLEGLHVYIYIMYVMKIKKIYFLLKHLFLQINIITFEIFEICNTLKSIEIKH